MRCVFYTLSCVSIRLAFPVGLFSQTSLVWRKERRNVTYAGPSGLKHLLSAPVSGDTLDYGTLPGSVTIYSTNMWSYAASTNNWSNIGGTGSLSNTCEADTATQPGSRHPDQMMAIDTIRNRMWMIGGVNS